MNTWFFEDFEDLTDQYEMGGDDMADFSASDGVYDTDRDDDYILPYQEDFGDFGDEGLLAPFEAYDYYEGGNY